MDEEAALSTAMVLCLQRLGMPNIDLFMAVTEGFSGPAGIVNCRLRVKWVFLENRLVNTKRRVPTMCFFVFERPATVDQVLLINKA